MSEQWRTRRGAELVRASKPFATEDLGRSWRELLVTLALQATAMTATAIVPWWPLKLVGSLLIGMLVVRLFIFMHDGEHGAIFRTSAAGRALIKAIGLYTLNTPKTWDEVHGQHHRTVAKPLPDELASLSDGDLINRTMTVAQWAKLSVAQRRRVRVLRNPTIMVFGLFTAFVLGHCIIPFIRNPRRYWLGPVALSIWTALLVTLGRSLGWTNAILLLVVPHSLAAMIGAYTFYAQHNFPAAQIADADEWHPIDAAITGASYFEMSPLMHWFTGNIGYHHVHHINHRIPFYRLPEAMAALPELQNPGRTSWHPREIYGCLRSSVWDPEAREMISFGEADRRAALLPSSTLDDTSSYSDEQHSIPTLETNPIARVFYNAATRPTRLAPHSL
ncbi:MAG: fatty acid desaturase [Myxococcales bacterium]|nr:fatty acid desaturase [Myxococcales bacterium]